MIALLSIVGALAVLCFVLSLVLGLLKGWQDPAARRLLQGAAGLGIACAVIGVLIALLGG